MEGKQLMEEEFANSENYLKISLGFFSPVSDMYKNPFLLLTANLIGLLNGFSFEAAIYGNRGVFVNTASKFLPHIPMAAVFFSTSSFSSSFCTIDNTALSALPTIPLMLLCDSNANIIFPFPSSPPFFKQINNVGQCFIVKSLNDSSLASNKMFSGFSAGINKES